MPRASVTDATSVIRARLRQLVESDIRSISAIAAAAKMSQSQLSNVLTGQRDDPRIATVARILAALGKRWRDLD